MAPAFSTDLVRQYLREIGRVPLLADHEELLLAREVQHSVALERQRGDGDWEAWARRCGLGERDLRQALHRGRRARERMIQANLRLVVAVAKKYQRCGIELLDLVQEGTLGLERAVDRFSYEHTAKAGKSPVADCGLSESRPGPTHSPGVA